MIAFSSSLRIYLCCRAVDMRKSFDGLCGEVRDYMGEEPTSGSLFLFINRRRDRAKILVWDRTGFWLLYKRLEEGRIELPATSGNMSSRAVGYEHLVMMLEGIDMGSARFRRRYTMKNHNILCLDR